MNNVTFAIAWLIFLLFAGMLSLCAWVLEKIDASNRKVGGGPDGNAPNRKVGGVLAPARCASNEAAEQTFTNPSPPPYKHGEITNANVKEALEIVAQSKKQQGTPNEDILSGQIKSFSTVDDMLDSLKRPWDER